jgi:xylulokinase
VSLLGLDVGTTGCKAIVFSREGDLLAKAYREYEELYPHPGWAEIDPDRIWDAIKEVVAAVASKSKSPVEAISTSVLGEAFHPSDKSGRLLRRTITSVDGRAQKQTDQLRKKLSEIDIFRKTGLALHRSYALPKMMWIRDNEPEIFRKTWKFLHYGDYVASRMGVEPVNDLSVAGRSLMLDVRKLDWSEEMLKVAGMDRELLPRVAPAGEVIGEIPAAIASQLGLPKGVKVVTGGHDQPVCALGAGVLDPGVGTDTTGTVECMTIAMKEPILTEAMLKQNLSVYPHVVPDRYITLAFVYSAGNVLRWYRDKFAVAERAEAEASGRDVYDIMIERAEPGPAEVFLLPHFTGSGTPYLDGDSRGAILGLRLVAGSGHIVRAILDGIAYEMRVNLEALKEAGLNVKRLHAIGGGAKSDAWLQSKADILGVDLHALSVSEAGCLGAAMLAGTAIGVFPSLQKAVKQLVSVRKVFKPRKRSKAPYDKAFAVYKRIYPAIRDVNHAIADFAREMVSH